MAMLRRLLYPLLAATVVYIAAKRQISSRPDEVQVVFDPSQTYEHEESMAGRIVRRIVAVGDLHGDMPNALKVLHMADVVDEFGNWTGNVDYFVQTGDIIDRGDDTIKLFLWMERLRSQARDAGGDVLSHLGNHEWMNVLGDWRYVWPGELKTFGSVEARQKMLSTGRIGKAWLQNYTVTSRLPLHPLSQESNVDFDPEVSNSSVFSHAALSFVHGGLSPTYQFLTPYPSKINHIGKTLLEKIQSRPPNPPHPPNPYKGLPEDATFEEQSLLDTNGPLWYRGWAEDNEIRVCGAIDDVLHRTGVRRLIMGHTPNFKKIVSRCGGKIIIIDTGISHAYGGALSALSIVYTLTPSQQEQDTWLEQEVVTALYTDRQEVLVVSRREISEKLWT